MKYHSGCHAYTPLCISFLPDEKEINFCGFTQCNFTQKNVNPDKLDGTIRIPLNNLNQTSANLILQAKGLIVTNICMFNSTKKCVKIKIKNIYISVSTVCKHGELLVKVAAIDIKKLSKIC